MLTLSARLALRRVISFASDKGGVYKTSTVANVGGLLAAAEWKTLLIDLDPQGNLGEDLGYTERGDDGASLYRALIEGAPLEPLRDVRPGLDVLTGGEYVYTAQETLDELARTDLVDARSRLARALETIAPRYDVVLIDTPPKIRSLQELALVASRWMLVPAKTDSSSHKGVVLSSARFEAAREINPSLGLLGVVLVGAGERAVRIKADARARLATSLGGDQPLFTATIRHVEGAAVDARNRGLLAHELEVAAAEEAQSRPWWKALREKSAGEAPQPETQRRLSDSARSLAEDYQGLAEEIVNRLGDLEAIIAKEQS